MGALSKLSVIASRGVQLVVALGVMVVIPVGWFFFDWAGPLESGLGRSFVWRVGDVVLWTVGSIAAMFVNALLEQAVERLSAKSKG